MKDIMALEVEIFSGGGTLVDLASLHEHYARTGNVVQEQRILQIMEARSHKRLQKMVESVEIFFTVGVDNFVAADNVNRFTVGDASLFSRKHLPHFMRLLHLAAIRRVLISESLCKKFPELVETIQLLALQAQKPCSVLSRRESLHARLDALSTQAEEAAELKKMLHVPSEIMVPTVSGPCNIRCRFCEQAYDKFPARAVDFDLFKQVVRAVPEKMFIKTQLTPYQEPLTLKKYFTYLEYILKERPEANVGFNTNGSHLTEERARYLVDVGLKYIVVSLNMPDAESYKWFTGRDYFDRVVQGIKHLARVKREKNAQFPKVIVQFLNIPPVLGQEKPLHDYWIQHGDYVFFRNVSAPSGSQERMRELEERAQGSILDSQVKLPGAFPCISPFVQLTVDYEGRYYPCCTVYRISFLKQDIDIKNMSVGHVSEMDYMTAWRGPQLHAFRAWQLAGFFPVCASCLGNQTQGEQLLRLRNAVFSRFYGVN